MTRVRPAVIVLCGLVACGSSTARAEDSPPAGLLRTHFTVDAGLPGAIVDKIVQTPDGFLWLITGEINLVRFDGRRFHHFSEVRAFTVAVAPDGDLWVGTRRGVIKVPASRFDKSMLGDTTPYHPDPANARDLICIRVARGGGLWIGTVNGLFRYDGKASVAIGPRVPILGIEEAPDGHLWFLTGQGVMQVDGSEVRALPEKAERLGVEPNHIFHVLTDRRGQTWYSTANGIARETAGQIERLGTYGGERHGAFLSYEDREGTVWIGKHEGLFRANANGLEPVAPGMKVRALHSDRDGNLWVGTNGDGLYRYRRPAIRMFAAADGLPDSPIMTVIRARDGTIWTGANCGGLSRFDGERFETFDEKHGLLNSCVFAITEDANGDLWIGTWGGGAFRYNNGQFTPFTTKNGMPHDRVTSIVAARDGTMWFGTYAGVVRLKDGQLRTFTTTDGLSRNAIYRVFEDRAGVIWAVGRDGLDQLVGERFQNVTALPRSLVVPIGEARDGGLFLQDLIKRVTLRFAKGLATPYSEFSSPLYMLETEQGELWFGGDAITRVPPGQFERVRQPDEPFDYERFSVADGLTTAEVSVAGQRTLALADDGTLWAATLKGVAKFDRGQMALTTARPLIYLTEVTIGRNTVGAGDDIVLPAGTSHLRIDFSAVELSSPEKIRMQYRLDGVDSEWLDAGRDPHAIYSTLPPGTHTLRIRATNRSGIWDRQGVTFRITKQPFFYQTRWFAGAMVAVGLLFVGFVHRMRVRQMSRAMSARFDERLAERTRVARELHDTFLQTVQGSKLVADHALRDPTDHTRMRRAMEQLSAWLERATEEGRTALNSLRASTTETNDLAEAFRRAIDECRGENVREPAFSVEGASKETHPIVRDEIYRIGYEAIRNACLHSGGDRVEVLLSYGHDLMLRISDDGAGMDAEIIDKGKEGHFGIRGMRERAERIGARLTLSSAPGSGTVVTLVVPGRIVFSGAHRHGDTSSHSPHA